MQIAKDSLLGLMSQLRDEDRFGLVTFNENATVIQELKPWIQIDKKSLKEKIMKLEPGGGTSLISGNLFSH